MPNHPRRARRARLAVAGTIAGALAAGALAGPAMAAGDADGSLLTPRKSGGDQGELMSLRKAGGEGVGYIIAVL